MNNQDKYIEKNIEILLQLRSDHFTNKQVANYLEVEIEKIISDTKSAIYKGIDDKYDDNCFEKDEFYKIVGNAKPTLCS